MKKQRTEVISNLNKTADIIPFDYLDIIIPLGIMFTQTIRVGP